MENLILQKCCGNATAPARAGGESFKEESLRPFIVKIDAHMSAGGRTDAAFGAFEVLGLDVAAWLSLHPTALAHIWDWGEAGAGPKLGLELPRVVFIYLFIPTKPSAIILAREDVGKEVPVLLLPHSFPL